MDRRAFFGVLAGGLTLDPERLLWVPGKTLISIPKPSDRYECSWAPGVYRTGVLDNRVVYTSEKPVLGAAEFQMTVDRLEFRSVDWLMAFRRGLLTADNDAE